MKLKTETGQKQKSNKAAGTFVILHNKYLIATYFFKIIHLSVPLKSLTICKRTRPAD